MMKVLHISPTYFSEDSFIGGGERYAYELAKAMARKAEVVFLSYADKKIFREDGPLKVRHLRRNIFSRRYASNPFSLEFVRQIMWADVIHCHQAYNLSTDMALVLGKASGKKVFVTDLGGGDKFSLSHHLPLLKRADALLLISDYSQKRWQATNPAEAERSKVIYGGVDTQKFSPGDSRKNNRILFVGRLAPHKGIDYLVEAVNGSVGLDIVGPVCHPRYFEWLEEKSRNKEIHFHFALDDEALIQKYREALVTVLPSVYTDCYGRHSLIPELLGLAVLESMACGTPVIVSEVASLPEIVKEGVTGFIVRPNSPEALREKIQFLLTHPETAREMGRQARQDATQRFPWDQVVGQCLKAYQSNGD